MPYKGSNAEKLHNMNMYDLLCRIRQRLRDRADHTQERHKANDAKSTKSDGSHSVENASLHF